MDSIPAAEVFMINNTTRGLVMTLWKNGTDTEESLRERIANTLSPEMMFNKGTAPSPSIWPEIRKLHVARNVTLKTHQSHRTIYTVAKTIYTNTEENEIAIERAKRILNGTIYREGTSTQQHENKNNFTGNAEKTGQNIAMWLKDSEQNFSGNLARCWQDYKDEYEQISDDYGLREEQRLRYLHNLLCKDVHRFYLETVKPNVKTYAEAINKIGMEYNSIVCQTRVKNCLNKLLLEQCITSDIYTAAVLAKIYKRILTMSRKVPKT